MAKTNAERQRAYAQRQRELLGDEEYKKQQAAKQKVKYHKKASKAKERQEQPPEQPQAPKPEQPQAPKAPEPLKALKRRPHPISKSILKHSTKAQYITFIKKFYNNYTQKILDDNHDIIKAINTEKYNYKKVKIDFNFINTNFNDIIKTYAKSLNLVYAIFTRIRGITPFIKRIYPYQEKLKDINEENRQSKVIESDISFNKDDIIKKLANSNLTYAEKLLYGLSMLLPTRRYEDWRITKIVNSQPTETNDTKYNYYYDGKIYIYNSKTDTRSITQKQKSKIRNIVNIPQEIIKLIDITKEYLLGKLYSQPVLSRFFKNSFIKVYNKQYKLNEIRRLQITAQNDKGLSYTERKELAEAMNHSVDQQARYVIDKNKQREAIIKIQSAIRNKRAIDTFANEYVKKIMSK